MTKKKNYSPPNSTNANDNKIKGNQNQLNISHHYPAEYNPELMFNLMQSEINDRKKVECENELLRAHIQMLTEELHQAHDQLQKCRTYNNTLLFKKT